MNWSKSNIIMYYFPLLYVFQDKSDLETKSTRKLYENMLNVEDSFVNVGTQNILIR